MKTYSLAKSFRILFSLWLILLAQHGQSQSASFELQSLLPIKPFPNSSLQDSEMLTNTVYQVPLGILQRSSGRAAPEESTRVTGQLYKFLYEVDQGFYGQEAKDYLQEQFELAGFAQEFACQGRACGSSNDWANDVFGNRLLYGPSQNQFFMTYHGRSAADDFYVMAYIITRGNRKVYTYLEVIETSVGSDSQRGLDDTLTLTGFAVLENLLFDEDTLRPDQASIKELVSVLSENPSFMVYIVAHLNDEESLAQLESRSQRRAESIIANLIESGIAQSRLLARGVGPLSPGCSEEVCRNRVEVILR